MVSRRISPRARSYVRRRATGVMEWEIRIERKITGRSYDPDTFVATTGSRETLYEGPARVWTVNMGPSVAIGAETVQMQQTRISIPWDADPIPRIDDEFVILDSHVDSAMIGRRGHITGTPKAGDLRPTRTFDVTLIEDDGDHDGLD